ncbi:hypothetical protein [Rhizobium tumorigenes]|uniref:Uncharacterized protein n=1 Tax=Rhizobium tumorigenes TaxID=2041385 RepID=A0AAF1K847_9HYPH|nr:hypothetical protein [Rhizobium tumorigenes]WFR97723.1 hypothetical protein PR017_21385 [Rhizobium tumorigenes]
MLSLAILLLPQLFQFGTYAFKMASEIEGKGWACVLGSEPRRGPMLILMIIFLLLHSFYVGGGNFIVSLVGWPLVVLISLCTWGPAWGMLSASFIVLVVSALPLLASVSIIDRITR